MPSDLSTEVIARIKSARLAKKLTQIELADAAKVSVRTVVDLEKGRRTSFNDDTMVRICRALDLDLNALMAEDSPLPPHLVTPTQPPPPAPLKRRISWKLAAVAVVAIALLVAMELRINSSRTKVTLPEPIQPAAFNWRTTDSPEWKSFWSSKSGGVIFNSLDFPRGVAVKDTVTGTLHWSFHYPSSRPGVYTNVFCDWSPEAEILLFSSAISGDSSLTSPFSFIAPSKPGAYRIRAYIAPLVSPVVDFNGTQIKDPLVSNHLPQYVEAKIIVFPKRLKDKIVNELP